MAEISVVNILEKYSSKAEHLMPLLQDIQSNFGYISQEHMELICDYIGISLSQAYSVVTFYQSFKLEPQGEHDIKVCLGTACHLKSSQRIMDEVGRKLGILPGETTKDMQFTYNSVNCVGACALAPVVLIDDEFKTNFLTTCIYISSIFVTVILNLPTYRCSIPYF